MARYLTEEEINSLKKRGLLDDEIKEVKEILKWYHKKGSNLDIVIDGEAILKLTNLKVLLKEPEVYGIRDSGVIREIVLNELDKRNSECEYKELCTATIWNSAPDYMEMGGTQYYRIYLNNNILKIYCLDNFFRLIQVKNTKVEDIKGYTLKDSIYFEGQNLKIYYVILNIEDSITDGKYFMYSTQKMDKSTLPKFCEKLKENGVAEIENIKPQNRTRNKIAIWLYYGFFIVAIIVLISELIKYYL